MKTLPMLMLGSLLLAAAACDTSSNLSTGVEQQPKTTFDQSPATLPTNPSPAVPSTPRLDSPGAEPAEDPAAGGTSHTPRALDMTDGGLTSDPAAAKASAKRNKSHADKPMPQ